VMGDVCCGPEIFGVWEEEFGFFVFLLGGG